ncbi:hypothetical protein F4X88_10190 [Candidatus Poribacteria bacterium]|nr:hypothetical protein [Candidatus Poribacteria bacterium]MYA56654.1 hypothetical protein [Candidatus Poribacteria bacterium]
MFRDVLLDRMIFAGVTFFVLVIGAQLYRWHGCSTTAVTLAAPDAVAQQVIIAFDNKPKHLPTTINEAIAHTEACLYLWPDETTHQSLLQLKHLKASGFKQFLGVE